jgi:sensor histidine kinase YesM
MKARYVRMIIELVAWSVFLGLPLIIFPSIKPLLPSFNHNKIFAGVIVTHAYLIAFYYFNYYYALPRYYFTKKYAAYFIIALTTLVLLLLINVYFDFNPIPPFRFSVLLFLFTIIVRFLMMFLLSMGLMAYNRLKEAEEEKLKSELSYLKAQINPHFLFNTLNSIYALTVKKSDVAPESVTRLAAIMRYTITEAENDYVPVEKEIAYVSSYIDLEKLRLTSKVNLDYSVEGELAGKQIAPLIFIPLIENAFKHGVSTSEQSEIKIHIKADGKQLHLFIQNTRVRRDKTGSNGLGIENVRKRLNLLYPGHHRILISSDEEKFTVKLDLDLK